MERNLSNDGGIDNRNVHDTQVALLRFEATHPRDSECPSHSLVTRPGRRYCLNRQALQDFRRRMYDLTLEAQTHDAQSPEWVAKRVMEAAERALVAIGVERML